MSTLTWSSAPPDEPGWWFCRSIRGAWEGIERIYRVKKRADGLYVTPRNGTFPMSGPMGGAGYEWAGPIPEPEEEQR